MDLTFNDYLRLVVDPVRLAVLGAAARGDTDIAAIAADLGVSIRKVHEARGKLTAAGLLTSTGALARDRLRAFAEALPRQEPIDPSLLDDGWTPEEAEVLSRFFTGSRLLDIPSGHQKRIIVLERLAQEFEPGIRYDEREVNFTLGRFHPDYAALRRYLVDYGFLSRADGVYWRTGGRS